jgi:hypothetical protein
MMIDHVVKIGAPMRRLGFAATRQLRPLRAALSSSYRCILLFSLQWPAGTKTAVFRFRLL